jgi:ubiquinone/menaquinone biosynthesis C-methylase UbiE
MSEQIRFDDGAAYERMMGVWSRYAGEIFLDWLALPSNLRWIDIGCGNGAFTELIEARCAPAAIEGLDPSDGQIAFARTRPGSKLARFQIGDAMALPFPDNTFNIATMALVIFFVPEPAKGVCEMTRVVAPGGTVAAYAWDMAGGGFPLQPVQNEMRALGYTPLRPPSEAASRLDAMQKLWSDAGMESVETRTIDVERTFTDFEDYWSTSTLGSSVQATLATMQPDHLETLKSRMRNLAPAPDADGRLTYSARANAVKGRVPR